MIREAVREDLPELLRLYLHLHETSLPDDTEALKAWEAIERDSNHHILLNIQDGIIAASCVCVIIPNLTRGARPYAFVENVVTRADCRGRGYATQCLHHAIRLAKEQGCYKIMLLTGSKEEKTLNFYRNAGFDSQEKTAFVQKLP